VSLKEEQSIEGFRAIFDEYYPDHIRLVSVGVDNSVEFFRETYLLSIAGAEAFAII